MRQKVAPATAEEQRQIRSWIDDAGKDGETVRDHALTELTKLGTLAEPAIRQALAARPPLEIKRRLETLLGTPGDAPAPLWLATQRHSPGVTAC